MSKRSLSEEEEIPLHSESESTRMKRQQKLDLRLSNDNGTHHNSRASILALAAQADSLIDCLKLVKESSGSIKSNSDLGVVKELEARLASISRLVVPEFQYFAKCNLDEKAPRNHSVDDFDKQKFENTVQNACVIGTVTVDAWTASDVPDALPPLPPVYDKSLEEAAFTHPGISQWQHYERLEWLGDAYLELLASILISQTFPKLSSGRCSQMRERLIRNTTLADYFRQYGLQSRAKLPTDLGRAAGRGRSNDKDIVKTQADMFEAYTAAAIISDPTDGLSNVIQWLRRLWAMSIQEDLEKLEKEEPTKSTPTQMKDNDAAEPATNTSVATETATKKLSPKEELAALIVVKGVWLHYEPLKCNKKEKNSGLPLLAAGAYLDGWGETHVLLGTGTALNLKEAGQKAAAEALRNKKLINHYSSKKRQFMKIKAEVEAAAIGVV